MLRGGGVAAADVDVGGRRRAVIVERIQQFDQRSMIRAGSMVRVGAVVCVRMLGARIGMRGRHQKEGIDRSARMPCALHEHGEEDKNGRDRSEHGAESSQRHVAVQQPTTIWLSRL